MSDVYVVVVAPEAMAEAITIARWWRKHRTAAPRLFQIELDRALVRLMERPEIGPKVRVRGRPGLRAVTLQRSGYLVFYEVDTVARQVIVARVRRGHRRPIHRR